MPHTFHKQAVVARSQAEARLAACEQELGELRVENAALKTALKKDSSGECEEMRVKIEKDDTAEIKLLKNKIINLYTIVAQKQIEAISQRELVESLREKIVELKHRSFIR